MKHFFTLTNANRILLIVFQFLFWTISLHAQQSSIKEYVLFGGDVPCPAGIGQKPCLTPGCAVQLGASTYVKGGSVGSYRLVKTTGEVTIDGNIYCGGKIQLANSNTVKGNLAAANFPVTTGAIFSAGSATKIEGNIDVNGNIIIRGGKIDGSVTHPAGTTYRGPVPGKGDITGTPALPQLPSMPHIAVFPKASNLPDINSTISIIPGAYDDIKLTGNKTVTFSGTGIYIFDKIDNSGSGNNFVFDFRNNTTGTFKIYIHRDANLGRINVRMINGGSATRIFTEIHGEGASNNNAWCFNISNGPSRNAETKWLGTVWAPYAAINIGSGSGNTNITGALWSGTQVNVQCGANIIYAPYSECSTPAVNAGPDKALDFDNQTTLDGSSSTPGATFSWQAINGGVITSPINAATITVSAAGTYILTATSGSGCFASDTAIVTGKTNNLIGSELQSVAQNFNVNSPPSPFFVIQHDSIVIDVIAKDGKYAEVLALLTTPAYGLTNIISNGTSNFIITGLFPISKLQLLNLLGSLIVYCRPYYGAVNNAGIITSAGDVAVRSDLVRGGYQLQGDGVKIGVISDSYNTIQAATTNPVTNTAAQDVGNGDLPGTGNPNGNVKPVHVLKDYPSVRTDEGRGMLQIVHDVAPKAELFFRTGFFSAGDFAMGIDELKQAGCNIIVDDVTFITEPFLKDGVVAAAVDAVAASGTTYFSAAGNFAGKSYENIYSPVAAPGGMAGTAHNFGGGDVFQSVNLSPGNYTIVLQWVDDIYSLGQTSAGGTKNDLDIYLTPNTNGTALFGFNRNNTNGDPIEILPFTLTSPLQTNILIVNNTPGSNPARFKYIVFRGDITFNEFATGTSTLVGQANAAGAIAVGAARFDKAPPFPGPLTIESFSSTGGTFINNTQRNKPELVAPDGVNTTVNLGVDYDNNLYANFFGTSAAAPHAAGVAALIMEGKKKYINQPLTSPAEIRTLLQSTATDMYTPGFDFTSGYGFINADAAMRTFAAPTPVIDQLQVPSAVAPGTGSFIVTVKGKYLSSNSVIHFRDSALATTVLNSEEATAGVPAFTGNPAISIYTPPISSSVLDGGSSDSLYFFNIIKKNIIVSADNKIKKYGEQIPALTATVLIDGVPLQNTGLTLQDLGLDNISFTTLATATSNVGTYLIRPSRIFDPLNPVDVGLQELYNFTFNQGSITINKMPVTLTPKDMTVTYGQKIPDIEFTYTFDGTNIFDPAAFLNDIRSAHQSQLAKDARGNDILGLVNGQAVTIVNSRAVPIVNGQAVTIVNGQAVTIVNSRAVPIVNGQAITIVNGQAVTIVNNLTAAETQNLNFLATTTALQNTRPVNNQAFVNGNFVTAITQLVDITQESILKFNINSAQTSMLSSVSLANARGLADPASLANGQAITIVNGQAVTIVNGQAVTIVNGQAVTIVNGQAVTIVNKQAIPIVNGQSRTAVVVDEEDIGRGASQLKSINMITGLTAGIQTIIPGSLLNDNFDMTYGLGKLTILPAPITIKAKDTAKIYGETITLDPSAFKISSGVLMYDDSLLRVTLTSTGTAAEAAAGIHPIIISNVVGSAGTNINNYSITYVYGALSVSKAAVIVKANDASKFYGDGNPLFTASFSGLVNGQTPGSIGITGAPLFNTPATIASGVGVYPIVVTQGSLSSANYSFSFVNGILTINKAPLYVKADDQVIYKGGEASSFTATITGFKAGDEPGVTYTVSSSCEGCEGVYTIIPLLKPFANSINYQVAYANGKLYINPTGDETKKLKPYLDCVEEILNPSSPGNRFIAHFYCINENRVSVYVPAGIYNSISSNGSFESAQLPLLFMPGTTRFNIPFDGGPLQWQLKSYEGNTFTVSSATASSSSGKCTVYAAAKPVNRVSAAVATNTTIAAVAEILPGNNVNVYPNPAKDRATIYFSNKLINEKGLSLYDTYGRSYPVKMVRKVSGHGVEIDLLRLIRGVYFMRVKVDDGYKTIRIVKE